VVLDAAGFLKKEEGEGEGQGEGEGEGEKKGKRKGKRTGRVVSSSACKD